MMTLSDRGNLQVVRLGLTPFRHCWDLQRRLLARRVMDGVPDTLVTTEHPPVYTIGRTGSQDHMLLSPEELQSRNIEFLSIERGGDVTYHGPGQLVGYPILNLLHLRPDLHWYVRTLEEAVIRTLARFGINGERHPRYTGVWVGNEKICAIGIHTHGWVTMHGFALNVCTDLSAFDRIVPCGIADKGVTSMQALLPHDITVAEVEPVCVEEFCAAFSYAPVVLSPENLEEVLSGDNVMGLSASKERASCNN